MSTLTKYEQYKQIDPHNVFSIETIANLLNVTLDEVLAFEERFLEEVVNMPPMKPDELKAYIAELIAKNR